MKVGEPPVPKWGYSVASLDPETTVKASGRELRVSHKSAMEVCRAIKGMKLDDAKEFLEQVMQKTKAVPFRRHKKKMPHRKGLQKAAAGKYPVRGSQGLRYAGCRRCGETGLPARTPTGVDEHPIGGDCGSHDWFGRSVPHRVPG